MFQSTSNENLLMPFHRAAAIIRFSIAPCSEGFIIVAVSENLIRSIMVGDDPEMLMSDLQNRFPTEVIEIIENDEEGFMAQAKQSILRS